MEKLRLTTAGVRQERAAYDESTRRTADNILCLNLIKTLHTRVVQAAYEGRDYLDLMALERQHRGAYFPECPPPGLGRSFRRTSQEIMKGLQGAAAFVGGHALALGLSVSLRFDTKYDVGSGNLWLEYVLVATWTTEQSAMLKVA